MAAPAELLPPRVGVGLPADYELLDLADPRYAWARRLGVQAAALSRRGTGTPAGPISFIQLTVAVVRDWSVDREPEPERSDVDGAAASTADRNGSTVDGAGTAWAVPAGAPDGPAQVVPPVPAADDDWLRPPAYLLVNGLPAAQLVVRRRLRLPGAQDDIRSVAVEVLVPLAGSGHVVVVTAATPDPVRQAEAEWTALAVAGTLAYRPAARPRDRPAPADQPVPELRFADPARLLAPPDLLATAGTSAPHARPGAPARVGGPPRGTIGQAAVDQLAGLVAVRRPAARPGGAAGGG
jgi:hypothetical protein